jgi:hypothetical protein
MQLIAQEDYIEAKEMFRKWCGINKCEYGLAAYKTLSFVTLIFILS